MIGDCKLQIHTTVLKNRLQKADTIIGEKQSK